MSENKISFKPAYTGFLAGVEPSNEFKGNGFPVWLLSDYDGDHSYWLPLSEQDANALVSAGVRECRVYGGDIYLTNAGQLL